MEDNPGKAAPRHHPVRANLPARPQRARGQVPKAQSSQKGQDAAAAPRMVPAVSQPTARRIGERLRSSWPSGPPRLPGPPLRCSRLAPAAPSALPCALRRSRPPPRRCLSAALCSAGAPAGGGSLRASAALGARPPRSGFWRLPLSPGPSWPNRAPAREERWLGGERAPGALERPPGPGAPAGSGERAGESAGKCSPRPAAARRAQLTSPLLPRAPLQKAKRPAGRFPGASDVRECSLFSRSVCPELY